jgi:hypothetical protein
MAVASESQGTHPARAELRSRARTCSVGQQLGGPIVLALILVLDLCVVQIALDLLRGALTTGSIIALALVPILGIALAKNALRRRRRRATAKS